MFRIAIPLKRSEPNPVSIANMLCYHDDILLNIYMKRFGHSVIFIARLAFLQIVAHNAHSGILHRRLCSPGDLVGVLGVRWERNMDIPWLSAVG